MDYLDNRELSWLKFNKRVLEEAYDESVPLFERLAFSAIYQNNLDEFFMVRVGSLKHANIQDKKQRDSKTQMTPSEQLDAIFTTVRRLQTIAEDAFSDTFDKLKEYGFERVTFDTASDMERGFLELYFKREIKPLITPFVVDKKRPFPFLKNKELYIAVQIKSKKDVTVGIVPVKYDNFERIIPLSKDGKRFILAEEVILKYAHTIFKNYKIIDRTIIRVTRNADVPISEKDGDFREKMEELVIQRKKRGPVRLELSDSFSRNALDFICKKLDTKNFNVFYSRIPLDLSFLFSFSDMFDMPEMKYPPRTPQPSISFTESRSIASQVKRKDVLLSYPYESITPFIKLLQESAVDPKVISIKITLYRVAKNSKIIDALCTATENGKDILVLTELRARFDEENNIGWSKLLQRTGCKVIYGPKDYKVHSKLLLITRKNKDGFEYITQIGTGNYNEKTSKTYTDLSLITSNPTIASDAKIVFDKLLTNSFVEESELLLVAPLCLKNRVLEMMDDEIELAKSGKPAFIGAKINSLSDTTIINKLIEASQAGVKIELVVRGLCCVIGGVEGYTENIVVRSIVGRYLEHSRIYIFGTEDRSKIYISSADYMTRNTTRRVEVATPILDEKIKSRLWNMFQVFMNDNTKARLQRSDGTYVKLTPANNTTPISAQEYLFDESYKKARAKELRIQKRKEKTKGKAN